MQTSTTRVIPYCLEKDKIEELFNITCDVVYDDKKSISMAEVCVIKWESKKKKSL